MITRVDISKAARRDLATVPRHVAEKLAAWRLSVQKTSLEEVRKLAGYHDEPLKGDRTGQRSIRLSKAYRAIYEILKDGTVSFVSVEEVTKHKY